MAMFARFVFAAAGLLLALASPAGAAPVYRPVVLAVHPHNSEHFTQGLFFFQDELYESTGLYGQSVLARKNALTGESLWEMPLAARFFGEGACQANGRIYMLTWKERSALVIDPVRLVLESVFSYPGEGWGLTFDGQRLVRSDGSDTLFFHELSGKITRSLTVFDGSRPVDKLNELEHDPRSGLILANIWYSPLVAAISGENGQVEFWLDLTDLIPPGLSDGAVANGLALAPDGQSLWLTGKLWPVIYQIAWPPQAPQRAAQP